MFLVWREYSDKFNLENPLSTTHFLGPRYPTVRGCPVMGSAHRNRPAHICLPFVFFNLGLLRLRVFASNQGFRAHV